MTIIAHRVDVSFIPTTAKIGLNAPYATSGIAEIVTHIQKRLFVDSVSPRGSEFYFFIISMMNR